MPYVEFAPTRHRSLPDSEIRDLIRRTRDETLTPAERIEARNAVLLANTGWRLKTAYRIRRLYKSTVFEVEDLADEAMIAEINAIEQFNLDATNKYVTYARWWIYQGISKALAKRNGTVQVPAYLYRLNSRIWRTVGRTGLSEHEAAKKLGISDARFESAQQSRGFTRTFSEVESGSPYEFEPWIESATIDQAEYNEEVALLREALAELDPRYRDVVESRMNGDGLREIAERLGVSKERVRQIEKRALGQIRERMTRGEGMPV